MVLINDKLKVIHGIFAPIWMQTSIASWHVFQMVGIYSGGEWGLEVL